MSCFQAPTERPPMPPLEESDRSEASRRLAVPAEEATAFARHGVASGHDGMIRKSHFMKAPLILGLLFLLAPMLPAADTLLDDGPPGFLHFHRVDKESPDMIKDIYLRISTIGAVTIFTATKNTTAPYQVRVLSLATRHLGEGKNEPLAFHLNFTKKEDAENVMLKITRLVNEDK